VTPVPPITTIAIVTADRPVAVRRCLDALVRQCDVHTHRPRFLVIDGSRTPEHQTATEAVTSAVAPASGHAVAYVGTTQATHFLTRLMPDAAVASSLMPGSIGSSRNLLLLLTAGEHILTVDDDVICDTWALRGDADSVSLMGHQQERLHTHFWPDRASAFEAIDRMPIDVLTVHGALLGHSLPTLIATSPRAVDLAQGCGHLRSALAEGRPLVVKVTLTGLAGDAGTYCPYRLLFSGGPLRARLWADSEAFTTALRSRDVTRIAPTRIVTHDSSCMATCMGLANSAPVPPFMPVGRNEDGVFGAMLSACDPSVAFGHVPFGIIHDSDRTSERTGTAMLSATESRVSELILSLVTRTSLPEASTTPAAAMRRTGQAISALGEMDGRALMDLATTVTREIREREFAHAMRAAEDARCPDYWRRELREYRRVFLESSTTPAFFLPIEFHGLGSVEAGYRALGGFFRDLGRLVDSWPDMWQRARVLNPHAPVA
jgi:hypothetical protein